MAEFFITVIIFIVQFVLGQLLGFGLAMGLGVGNGWELVVIPAGNVLGIWGVGAGAAALRGRFNGRAYAIRLLGAVVAAGVGTGIILLTPATGFAQLLYPLLGALIGYYAAGRWWTDR